MKAEYVDATPPSRVGYRGWTEAIRDLPVGKSGRFPASRNDGTQLHAAAVNLGVKIRTWHLDGYVYFCRREEGA